MFDRSETSIEEDFVKELQRWCQGHRIQMAVLKLNVAGRRGWPDRQIMWDGGNIVFIEFKKPGEEARPLQSYIHHEIRQMGFEIAVHDNTDAALDWVKAQIRASASTTKSPDVGGEGGGVPAVPEAGKGEDGSSS